MISKIDCERNDRQLPCLPHPADLQLVGMEQLVSPEETGQEITGTDVGQGVPVGIIYEPAHLRTMLCQGLPLALQNITDEDPAPQIAHGATGGLEAPPTRG